MKSAISIQPKGSRRKKALFITLITAAIIATLLYFEQVAVIYLLSTIGLIVLLLVVAFADLEKVGKNETENESVIKKN